MTERESGRISLSAMGMKELTEEQRQSLMADLQKSDIKTREGPKGMELSYVSGFYVYDTLTEILGPGQWGGRITRLEMCVQPMQRKNRRGIEQWYCSFYCSVEVSGPAMHPNEDVGYGSGIDTYDPGAAIESAIKECVTDAVKRAVRPWGRRTGHALYDDLKEHIDKTGLEDSPSEDGPPAWSSERTHSSPPPQGSDKKLPKSYFKIGFGPGKGKLFDEATEEELTSWWRRCRETVEDASKQEWHERSQKHMSAIKRLIKDHAKLEKAKLDDEIPY